MHDRLRQKDLRRGTALCSLLLFLCVGGCRPSQPRTPARPATAEAVHSESKAPATPQEVRAILERAARDAPDDPYAHLELALFERQAGNLQRAEQLLIACWKRFPNFARAPFHLGMLYLMQERNVLAVPPLRAAARLDPKDPIVQVNAGFACQRAGMKREALAYARVALQLDPQRPDPYLLLARLHDTQGTADEALRYLDQYIARSPTPATGYYLKGRIHARRSEADKAELWVKRAIEAEPNNANFWTTLGRIYTELYADTRTEEGLRCFQRALELSPDNPDTHRYYGLTLKRTGRYAEAIPHLEQALKESGGDIGPLYFDYGQALLQAGRTQEGQAALARYREYREYTRGIQALNRALLEKPRDRARHHARIRFCLKHRQYGPAAVALQQALEMVGPDATLRALMEELRRAAPAAGLPANSSGSGL
ncbi:MAG: tetratricopeptide repeat protein [Chthonomonadaceae bacterium]|nr:tetratricopeptide repeat protein [Chthonomonadaceae bacterium]